VERKNSMNEELLKSLHSSRSVHSLLSICPDEK
jgi:hypothetical protein